MCYNGDKQQADSVIVVFLVFISVLVPVMLVLTPVFTACMSLSDTSLAWCDMLVDSKSPRVLVCANASLHSVQHSVFWPQLVL